MRRQILDDGEFQNGNFNCFDMTLGCGFKCLETNLIVRQDGRDITIDLTEGAYIESGYFGNYECICELPIFGTLVDESTIHATYLDRPVKLCAIDVACQAPWSILLLNTISVFK